MSSPALTAVAIAALCLGLPVVAASGALETKQRAAGAADTAALAAADAASGWGDGDPCARAGQVADAMRVVLEQCALDLTSGEARIVVEVRTVLGVVRAQARAGPPDGEP